jgi:hypothetical protein
LGWPLWAGRYGLAVMDGPGPVGHLLFH